LDILSREFNLVSERAALVSGQNDKVMEVKTKVKDSHMEWFISFTRSINIFWS
jgi:hypothetical protein